MPATRARLERLAGELGLLKFAPVPDGDMRMSEDPADWSCILFAILQEFSDSDPKKNCLSHVEIRVPLDASWW